MLYPLVFKSGYQADTIFIDMPPVQPERQNPPSFYLALHPQHLAIESVLSWASCTCTQITLQPGSIKHLSILSKDSGYGSLLGRVAAIDQFPPSLLDCLLFPEVAGGGILPSSEKQCMTVPETLIWVASLMLVEVEGLMKKILPETPDTFIKCHMIPCLYSLFFILIVSCFCSLWIWRVCWLFWGDSQQ